MDWGAVRVGVNATSIIAKQREVRRSTLHNRGYQRVYVLPTDDLTPATGIPIAPGQIITIDCDELYGVISQPKPSGVGAPVIAYFTLAP